MQNKNEWFRKLGEQVEILVAEPMKNHTTFRIGGPADALALSEDTGGGGRGGALLP